MSVGSLVSRGLRAALALGMLGALVGMPAWSASAGEAACAGTSMTSAGSDGARSLFTVPASDVPPPLRGQHWDCAAQPPPSVQNGVTNYSLLWVDVPFATVIDVLSSFRDAHWQSSTVIPKAVTSAVDDVSFDQFNGAELTVDQVQALRPRPQYLNGEFVSGSSSVLVFYTSGDSYTNEQTLTVPTLLVQVTADGQFAQQVGIADPSVLSSLRVIEAPTPTQTAVLCTSAVVLMLVVGWPAALLNGVIAKRAGRLFGWTQRGLAARIGAAAKKVQPRWLVWVGFVIAALIAGFVDPGFGPNLMSLRLLASTLLGYLVFNVLGWSVVAAVVRRLQPEAEPVINFRWSSLLVVAGAVFIARLLGFQPGVIFGLVAGLAFAVTLVAAREALVVLVGSAFALVAALLAWVAYSLLAPIAAGSQNFLLVLPTETLSGLTIEGISTLPLVLLPLAVLEGGKLFEWKKWVWAIAYAMSLAAFMYVLLTVPGSFGEVQGDFVRWVVVFVAFAVVAIAAWAVDARLSRRASSKHTEQRSAA